LRIHPIMPARASNIERASLLEPGHATNSVSFREVLAAQDAAPAHVAAPAWAPDDTEAFAVFVEANRRTESGGAAAFSTLRTTAGGEHRASFGVAQLSVREHLSRLEAESDARLAALGTSRSEIDAMRERGEATVAFYHLIVDGQATSASASTLGLDAARAARIRELAVAGDTAGLRNEIASRFTSTTGLPASALDEMLATRALRDPRLRASFAAQYRHDHGADFDPARRDGPGMAETARHLVLAHPELRAALTQLGGDDAAATSLAHYLGVGDSAENLLGWHARAASTCCGEARFRTLLTAIDGTTSRSREIEDFERALAAIADVSDLHGEARVATLARIGRIFHGSPTRAREALFVDGHLDAPRCHSRAELDALLDEMRSGRTWSDARLAEHVAHVVAERRAT
jgi:hypothetical protein